MKALTKEERAACIAKLVGNCKCEDKEKAALNSLSDVTLATMLVNAFPPKKDKEEDDEEEEPIENDMAEGSCASAKGSGAVRAGTGGDNAEAPKNTQNKETKIVANTASEKPLTNAEWMAKAPPEIRSMVSNQLKQQAAAKAKMVQTILGNAQNKFTEKVLNSMTIETLEPIAALAAQPVINSFFGNPEDNAGEADYSGAGLSGLTDNAEGDDALDMVPPTINWAEEAKAGR